MTSYYSQYELSQQTRGAYQRYCANPSSVAERRDFYLTYLDDVVPIEVTVHLVLSHLQPYDLRGPNNPREEIQLRFGGKIFMTCVVGLDRNSQHAEDVAGTLAYEHWHQGHCIADSQQAWGMFTALHNLRFCTSRDGREWCREANLHPTCQVQEVVAYFRQEFERVRRLREVVVYIRQDDERVGIHQRGKTKREDVRRGLSILMRLNQCELSEMQNLFQKLDPIPPFTTCKSLRLPLRPRQQRELYA
ncbi:MAG: hypothetical protein ASARMPRED_006386 [Alectoria sarmentosa]|nr:MAG: hypothetical protein ASARMPRED_006386 [Alectoria sarmentosa]